MESEWQMDNLQDERRCTLELRGPVPGALLKTQNSQRPMPPGQFRNDHLSKTLVALRKVLRDDRGHGDTSTTQRCLLQSQALIQENEIFQSCGHL